jgi:hypothetical protein
MAEPGGIFAETRRFNYDNQNIHKFSAPVLPFSARKAGKIPESAHFFNDVIDTSEIN